MFLLGAGGFYLLATHKHTQREETRQAAVSLTPACAEKLRRYALDASEHYRSPYVVQQTGTSVTLAGYSNEDVRAVQRGCNIVDDTQGSRTTDVSRDRWNTTRFIRSKHLACTHCHQGVGDKQDANGNRLKGSLHLGTSWGMADMYDRFTLSLIHI